MNRSFTKKLIARLEQTVLLLLVTGLLAACGQKGPLYLPKEMPPVSHGK